MITEDDKKVANNNPVVVMLVWRVADNKSLRKINQRKCEPIKNTRVKGQDELLSRCFIFQTLNTSWCLLNRNVLYVLSLLHATHTEWLQRWKESGDGSAEAAASSQEHTGPADTHSEMQPGREQRKGVKMK